MGTLFLSQDLERLAQCLSENLASDENSVLKKRWILVPHGFLKQWLSVYLASHSSKNVLAGCKICTPEEAILPEEPLIPTALELSGLLYREILNHPQRGETNPSDLAVALASFFCSYGKWGWRKEPPDWQAEIFKKILNHTPYAFPIDLLPEKGKKVEEPVHCFGFDHLPSVQWETLAALPYFHLYLFSPSFHFWEDLCTDWERKRLLTKHKAATLPAREALSRYLQEGPPLLRNWGKLGRESLKILDRFPFEATEVYSPIAQDSVLHRLQHEILSFEPRAFPCEPDESLLISQTGSSPMHEVEVMAEELIALVKGYNLSYADVSILSPSIESYAPLIEFVFQQRQIPYRLASLASQSPFSTALPRYLNLITKPWHPDDWIALIQTPALYKKQKWDEEKREFFIKLVRKIFDAPDWKTGFEKCIQESVIDEPSPFSKGISFSQFDALKELFSFFEKLEKQSVVEVSRSFKDWAEQLESFIESEFVFESDDGYRAFQRLILQMKRRNIEGLQCPFSLIEPHLQLKGWTTLHSNALHAVRIGSLDAASLVPSRAMFLLGLDEESFPRKKIPSSLDRSLAPEPPEEDRYLFLKLLFCTRDFLRISYGHLSPDDGKEVGPSILVQELCQVLNPKNPNAFFQPRLKKIAPKSLSPCFSFARTQSTPLPSQIVPLSDLVLFARHPWKHFLKKTHKIVFPDRFELNFNIQKSLFAKTSLKWSKDQVLQELPKHSPLVHEALRLDVGQTLEEWNEKIQEWGSPLFSLSLLQSATKKEKEEGNLYFPPLSVGPYSLIGQIPYVIEKGALYFGSDQIGGLFKAWPEILTALVALNTSQIFFLKSGKVKTISDPVRALSSFLEYYEKCSHLLTPLMPDWADAWLRKGVFLPTNEFKDEVIDWILDRVELPSSSELFEEWQDLAFHFTDLIELYPVRSRGGIHETV